MMLGFSGMFEALLLIALGIGYIVLYLAKREEKDLQTIGYIIGTLIMILAIFYLVGSLWLQVRLCPKVRHLRGTMQPRMMPQPMMPRSPAPSPK